jgi:lipid-A-disaccharide synthase
MNSALEIPIAYEAPRAGDVDLLIISGEHSGDEHAAEMLKLMREERPDLKVACLGGPKLEAAGAQLLYDLTTLSVVGFFEVVKHYGFFKKLFDCTLDWIEQYQPGHVCFVDYPGFNLRLAEALRKRGLSRKGGGDIGLSYYIGPQVWAWKAKRRFKMSETIDRLSVIFPFEVDCYKDTSLPVEYVVHPFLDAGYRLPFEAVANAPVLLLPGSRIAACQRIFPVLLAGYTEARKLRADLTARVIYPSEAIRKVLEHTLEAFPEIKSSVELVAKSESVVPAQAALMSSGTMSLSVALSGIPGAIVYRMHNWTYYLSRLIVKVPYIGISNMLLGRFLHPEFIQGAATAKALGAALCAACEPDAAQAAAEGAGELKVALNPEGAPSAAQWLLRGLS